MARSSGKYRVIPGERISQKEIIERIYQWKLSHYRFELEKIRVDDQLSPFEKGIRQDTLRYRIQALKDAHERGE